MDVPLDEVSEGTDWSQISPTVFGGVFESTLNPKTRRSGGCTTLRRRTSTG